MPGGPGSFDRLAGVYRALEVFAFGHDLERARFCLLDRLVGCESVLILGEGDGRFLERLVRVAPSARIDCFELSGSMITRAAARLGPADRARVRFERTDALTADFAPQAYDAVVTLFFLDCFREPEVEAITRRIVRGLRPAGLWLFADFALPPSGWRRYRARVWLSILYLFFRWQTRLTARSLPPSERLIANAGMREEDSRSFQAGLLRAILFQK